MVDFSSAVTWDIPASPCLSKPCVSSERTRPPLSDIPGPCSTSADIWTGEGRGEGVPSASPSLRHTEAAIDEGVPGTVRGEAMEGVPGTVRGGTMAMGMCRGWRASGSGLVAPAAPSFASCASLKRSARLCRRRILRFSFSTCTVAPNTEHS
eukprot:1195732-Prorocentrum_minimum.AAC.6